MVPKLNSLEQMHHLHWHIVVMTIHFRTYLVSFTLSLNTTFILVPKNRHFPSLLMHSRMPVPLALVQLIWLLRAPWKTQEQSCPQSYTSCHSIAQQRPWQGMPALAPGNFPKALRNPSGSFKSLRMDHSEVSSNLVGRNWHCKTKLSRWSDHNNRVSSTPSTQYADQPFHSELKTKSRVCPALCFGPVTTWVSPVIIMKVINAQAGPVKLASACLLKFLRTSVLWFSNTAPNTTFTSLDRYALGQQPQSVPLAQCKV